MDFEGKNKLEKTPKETKLTCYVGDAMQVRKNNKVQTCQLVIAKYENFRRHATE